jgi:putative addiction module CopG family antidote
MTKVTVTLRDENQRFIESAMREGRYVTESEAVDEAVSELRTRDEERQARLSNIREKVMAGIEQLDRGESSEWSAGEMKADGRALLVSLNHAK